MTYSAPAVLDHPWIDRTYEPVYVMRFPAETTDVELMAFCVIREQWAKHARYPCAWVADMSRVRALAPTQRKIFADHLKRFEPHDIAHNQGSAIVVPHAFLRGILTAVFWMSPPKFPNQVFADLGSALVWARSRVAIAA